LALAAAGLGIYTAARFHDRLPMLLQPSAEAQLTVENMLGAVSRGDYAAVSAMILGTPELGVGRTVEDPLGEMLWDAYQESLEFTAVSGCYTTQSGLAYDYKVRYLDWDSVMEPLRDCSITLFEKRVAEAEDMSQVYDENNAYRESFVMNVLLDAAEAGLQEDAVYVEATFTMNLVYQDGQWWIVADDALLSAVSGGLSG